MNAAHSSVRPPAPVIPSTRPRMLSFDPLTHARHFVLDRLQLGVNGQGNPKLFYIADLPEGRVDAGSIVWIPATTATLAGPAYPASIAITGRMAEYTPAQREVLSKAGVTFKPKPGDRKTFFTAYIPEGQLTAAKAAFTGLRTATGKDCLLSQFTARAIDLFQSRMEAIKDPS